MKVWVLWWHDGGVKGIYTTPEAAAEDVGIALSAWDRDFMDDGYELPARELRLTEEPIEGIADVRERKAREAEEEETRRGNERARRWIK